MKQISRLLVAVLLSVSSVLVALPKTVHAATVAWDGGGADNNFSTAANWVGDTVPVDGDILQFPTSVDSDTTTGDDRVLNNDLTNLSLAGIQVTGTYPTGDYDYYKITGNAITLTGDVLGSPAGEYQNISINVPLTVTSPLTLTKVTSNALLTIGSNAVTLDGVYFSSGISGTGTVTLANTDQAGGGGGGCSPTANPYPIGGNSSGFSGAVTVQGNGNLAVTGQINDFAQKASGITNASDGYLSFTLDNGQDMTYAKPTTHNGGSVSVAQLSDDTCTDGPVKTLTLSGNTTFTADTTFTLFNANLKFTGTVTGKNFVKISSNSSGTITFADNSTLTPQPTSTEYKANSPSTSIYVDNNETAIVTGTYGATTVGKGGTLKGTGTIGTLSVNDGGKLAPGMSPGCLNSGNLLFVAGSSYEFEVGGTTECTGYDQMKVTGTVTLGNGTLNVARYNGFKPVKGQTYKIIDNDGTDAVSGTFLNLAEGATFKVDGYVLKVSYVGGDGNDVVLTVMSVPSIPDTGIMFMQNHPLQTALVTTMLAGAMFVLAKRYQRVAVRVRK